MIELENIKISIDSNAIRYNEGITSKGNRVIICILPYTIKANPNYRYTLLTATRFCKEINDLLQENTLCAIGKAVLYQSFEGPGDTWNAQLGKKIAYAKAEINAYRYAMKRIYKINKAVTEALNKTSMNFLDKASNVISHNEEYLTKICGKSFD